MMEKMDFSSHLIIIEISGVSWFESAANVEGDGLAGFNSGGTRGEGVDEHVPPGEGCQRPQ